MKKTIYTLIALLMLSSMQAEQFKLQLNLKKGESYRQKMSSDMSIAQNVGGTDMNIKMNITAGVLYKVIGISNDLYEMEVFYENMSMKMNMPGVDMAFDSENDVPDNPQSKMLSNMLRTMVNKSFFMKLSKTGKVSEVKGVDSLFAHMFDNVPEIGEAQKQQFYKQMSDAYGEKALKGNFEMSAAIFPDKAVSQGDKWNIKTELNSGMQMQVSTDYTLNGISDSAYHLLGTSAMNTINNDSVSVVNGMPMRYDMSGNMAIDMQIDRVTGWVMVARIIQKFSGTAYIQDNAQVPGGLTLPMTINSVMVIRD